MTSAARATVRYRVVGPQPNELCIAAIVQPSRMVRFDNPAQLPVEFVQLPA